MKNLTTDRFMKKLERVTEIQDLVATGVTSISAIAHHFDIRWETAKSELQLGNILFNYQLSPENLAKRRKKINNKMMAVAEEAREQFVELMAEGAYKDALGFFKVYSEIWSKYLPGLWGLINGASDSGNISPINVDTVNFNKIDMNVSKEDVDAAKERMYDLADEAGVRIK